MMALQPVSPYVPRSTVKSEIRMRSDLPIDAGERINIGGEGERIGGAAKAPGRSLPTHHLPRHFLEHVDGGGAVNVAALQPRVADIFKRHEPLSRDNYVQRMHALLDLEELQSQIDIRQFDMKGGLLHFELRFFVFTKRLVIYYFRAFIY